MSSNVASSASCVEVTIMLSVVFRYDKTALATAIRSVVFVPLNISSNRKRLAGSFLTPADHLFDRIDLFHIETFSFRQVVGEHQGGIDLYGGGQCECPGKGSVKRLRQ